NRCDGGACRPVTDIKAVPAIPRPDMFIGQGGITPPGYSYLNELSTVLGEVRSLLSTVEGSAAANASAIEVLQNVEPVPSLLRQRSEKVTLEGGSPIGPTTAQQTLLSQQLSCVEPDSRVFAVGNCGHSHGSGGNDPDGTVVNLYVDGEFTGQGTFDWASTTAAVINTPFFFQYEPGDTEPHLYEVTAVATVSAIYGYSNWMYLEELAPNTE
ncbi:MAG: hypothetical protein KDE34_26130, partial [Anaerolineales bacterium]|nr:hypothetical protein [Anaerolineales bacterium]